MNLQNHCVIGSGNEYNFSDNVKRIKPLEKCDFCDCYCEKTTTAEFVLTTAPEDEKPQQGNLCDECLESKLIVLV
jgi:hypothetical protein